MQTAKVFQRKVHSELRNSASHGANGVNGVSFPPLTPCENISGSIRRHHRLDSLTLADARAAAVHRPPLVYVIPAADAQQDVRRAGERGVPGGGAAVVADAGRDGIGHGACIGVVCRGLRGGVYSGRARGSRNRPEQD